MDTVKLKLVASYGLCGYQFEQESINKGIVNLSKGLALKSKFEAEQYAWCII